VVLNLVGSAILAVLAYVGSQRDLLPPEAAWAAVSLRGLVDALCGHEPRGAH